MGKQRGKGKIKDDSWVFDLMLQLAGCCHLSRWGKNGRSRLWTIEGIMSYILDIITEILI